MRVLSPRATSRPYPLSQDQKRRRLEPTKGLTPQGREPIQKRLFGTLRQNGEANCDPDQMCEESRRFIFLILDSSRL
jgi:hypothetical protein